MSLVDLRFRDAIRLTSRSVARILDGCTSLRRFEVEQGGNGLKDAYLRELANGQWNCQTLTHLWLVVQAKRFQDSSYHLPDCARYSPLKPDTKRWKSWKRFYARLGDLIHLRIRVLEASNSESTSTFPELLGDSHRNIPGYLAALEN
ncbi:hypothetical protein BGX23_007590 [Mortierella sp. AD031]|nr:hypothetical protein BGX23_007590 [Mortierella sp. AD031]KAG0218230.1 hypothetical protein BGX33_008071 [Mortierella sp. NVP41]